MSRPDFGTIGTSVSASESVVKYLKPYLEANGAGANRMIDRVQTVDRHVGPFDKVSELKRWLGARDGGVRIAAMRIIGMRNQGTSLIGSIEFAAFIFMTDAWGYARDQRAEVIACRLAKALMLKGGWAGTGASTSPERVRADNLYSKEIDETGVAIWSVTWQQDWPLDDPIDINTLDDFLRFSHVSKVADGAPECEGLITLPGPDSE